MAVALPEELSKIFELYDSEDFNLGITNVALNSGIFTAEFEIQPAGVSDFEPPESKWILTTTGYIESRITFDYASKILISNEHPLLWKYIDTQCELYFNGQCQDIGNLFADIYDIHYELFENYTPFESFLNNRHLYPLMHANNGLLARGPKRLLMRYAERLKAHRVDFSIIGERVPTYWNGNSYIPESKDLKALFFSNTGTYVVAEDYRFQKQGAD
jgi:hypothetical protein